MNDYTSQIAPLISQDPRVTVGRFTYGNPQFKVWSDDESVSIGAFCSIADDVVIFGGGEHRSDWVTTFPLRIAFGDAMAGRDGHPASKGPTRIGNDVWIGHGATIISGVTVGDGAIIGARAVVTRDVAPYAVVTGNPATQVKMRFSPEQVDALLRIRWWDWPIEDIHAHQGELCGASVDSFVQRFSSR
ncbi:MULTISPECIES: CatB-related O-acetyltransferase [Stenotrophomonas]|uniref:CatB-related O-acetyltransferase n=1 Tax=Stenotrophomonas TaxID=40323 RepID=UPI000872230E|nr:MULTISPECIES: CatB-related O-acetyltransferase [Stenotrophomonas]OEZ01761.1 chloramphenicol acetyltransferase [Stenotrophomonas sp. BIIR7]